jgi:hypothetical protein
MEAVLRGRPALTGKALTLPYSRRSGRIQVIAQSLQPATSAVSKVLNSSLIIVSQRNMGVDLLTLRAMEAPIVEVTTKESIYGLGKSTWRIVAASLPYR